jgi:hypothetical protein
MATLSVVESETPALTALHVIEVPLIVKAGDEPSPR